MNAHTNLDRQAVDLARYDRLLRALMLAEGQMKRGEFWSSFEGLDAVRAINDFLSGEHPQEVVEVIQGELPDTTTEEDSDPYYGGMFPAMRAEMIAARAMGGRS